MSPPRRRLLLIDAEPVLRQILSEYLTAVGFAVHAVSGSEAPGCAPEFHVAVVDGAGAEAVCRRLKGEKPSLPVAVLGSALPGGWADAVFPKPLRLSSLSAKLDELISRKERASLQIGPWLFDPDRRLLKAEDGGSVRLTDKEAAILRCLGEAGGAVARDRLLSEVWGYSGAVSTHTLETHIYRLRRKMENDLDRPLIVTEAGGYRLAG